MQTTVQVKLLDHTPDPIKTMYVAFRTCYSSLTPQQIWAKIDSGEISREKMIEFMTERLKTGHASPRQQVWFTFAVSGIDRSCSHQFVRHHVGISMDQQSQRYVKFKNGDFPYVAPQTWKKSGLDDEFESFMKGAATLYERAMEAGVPAEDARAVLPNATSTNLVFTVNLEEILHIADQRLCWRAQWQIRYFWSKVRAEIKRKFPELAQFIQPKCGNHRMGYCDEEVKEWAKCPIGKVRPHKEQILKLIEKMGTTKAMTERDFQALATEP